MEGVPVVVWLNADGQPMQMTAAREVSRHEVDRVLALVPGPTAGRVMRAAEAESPQGVRCVILWADDATAVSHAQIRRSGAAEQILGLSPAIMEAKEFAARAATLRVPVLIEGETGTGKELFSKAIHEMSMVAQGPFVAVNCGAIPESLAESELFGYERGAFTGADRTGHKGVFEQAHGGTLFLDEISEMTLPLQAKLLRALEEGAVRRLGGTRAYPVSVRVVAASNRHLRDLVQSERFRADLYYRLNVLMFRLPSLAARQDDIIPLFLHYLALSCETIGTVQPDVDAAVYDALRAYPWPGNVRELRNVAMRAAIEGLQMITTEHLPLWLAEGREGPRPEVRAPLRGLRGAQEDVERQALETALAQAGGNKAEAARLLGIHRATLYAKLRRYRIDR